MTLHEVPTLDRSPETGMDGFGMPEPFALTLADTAAMDAFATIEGPGYLIVTFTPSETYIIGEDYPALARIWDNDEDDAAFASL